MKAKDHQISSFHLFKPFLGLATILSIGTFGYMHIEGWNFFDSLYMSVITLTTVGFDYVHPLSEGGKIFTLIYIIFGVILFLYLAAQFAEYIIFINFTELLSKKNMENRLNKIKDHYILCGYGRTGSEIAKQLSDSKINFVIIDKMAELEESIQNNNYSYVMGDATDDSILEKAKINEAKGLFCCLSDDVDNLYLTLSAKNLNPNLSIVTRCVKATNESKFLKAGANNIILPYEISGRRMVSSIMKPHVVDFLDVVVHTKGKDLELKMEQFKINKGSALENQTVLSCQMKQKTGIIVIAIKRNDEFITNPPTDTQFLADDYLIIMGTNQQLSQFEKIFI